MPQILAIKGKLLAKISNVVDKTLIKARRLRRVGRIIRHLRTVDNLSQRAFGEQFGVSRGQIDHYESGRNEPSFAFLSALADHYDFSLDEFSDEKLTGGELGIGDFPNTFQNAAKKGVLNPKKGELTRSTRSRNVLVPVGARAGYLGDWGQEYIDQELQYIDIPGVIGDARTFEVDGNSMNPYLTDGDYVVCEKLRMIQEVEERKLYVVVCRESGIYVKWIEFHSDHTKLLPTNPDYDEIRVPFNDIVEVWRVFIRITRTLDADYTATKELGDIKTFLQSKFPDFPQ